MPPSWFSGRDRPLRSTVCWWFTQDRGRRASALDCPRSLHYGKGDFQFPQLYRRRRKQTPEGGSYRWSSEWSIRAGDAGINSTG